MCQQFMPFHFRDGPKELLYEPLLPQSLQIGSREGFCLFLQNSFLAIFTVKLMLSKEGVLGDCVVSGQSNH